MWSIFSAIVAGMLFIDLFATSHRHHSMSTKNALVWSIVWISAALVFCLGIWFFQDKQRALEFLTGYIIEKSLSVDNLFVFIMIFSSFKLGPDRQPLVLKWGILGAVIMRVVLILFGVALLHAFHWVIYVFGAILLFTAYRMAFDEQKDIEIEKHIMVRISRKLFPVSCAENGERFFVREGGKLCATSLFVALLVIEASDLIFAVDSIPAVLGVTRDPFIAITSNIFAILGLRALYFLLANIVRKFRFLNYGVAMILAFVGVKMILADILHIPIGLSLGIICLILAGSVILSLQLKPKE
jgi:tellurite resistance protein TerC